MSKKGLWRPLETMGLKFGSHWVPFSYLGRAPGQVFFENFSIFCSQNGAPLKKQWPKSEEFLVLEGGYPGAPSDLRPPPPWANPRYVPEKGHVSDSGGIVTSSFPCDSRVVFT